MGRCRVYGIGRFAFVEGRSGFITVELGRAGVLAVVPGRTAATAHSVGEWSSSWQCLQGTVILSPWLAMNTWWSEASRVFQGVDEPSWLRR